MYKRIISVLLICACLLTMIACNPTQQGEEPTGSDTTLSTPDTDSSTPGTDSVVVFTKDDIKDFKIVYSIDLDSTEAVSVLSGHIKSMYGADIMSTNDVIVESNNSMREWEHEILLGTTNREESAIFGESLRNYDYGYGYVNGKIVIYAANDTFLVNAVNSFVLNVLNKNKDKGIFYQSDLEEKTLYAYQVGGLTVNGVEIRDYEIIYPETSTLFEKEMAQALQCSIQELTGWVVPMKKDSEAREKTNAIHVGKTKYAEALATVQPEKNEGIICSNGTDVVLYGNDMTGVVNATKTLSSLLLDSNEFGEKKTVTISETLHAKTPASYSTMSFNVYGGNLTALRKQNVLNNILRYLPDTVGIQECAPGWKTELMDKLSDYYGFAGMEVENGVFAQNIEGVPILYAKEKFNLIESGTHWLTETPNQPSKLPGVAYYRAYTWALLEDKTTGEQFLHLNTHLDIGGDKYRYEEVRLLMGFLQEYNDVPIVITGDMNAYSYSESMKLFAEHGLKSALDYSSPMIERPNTNWVDWVFITGDCMTMVKHEIDEMLYNGVYSSDHFAAYSEFTLQIPENGVIDHKWYVEFNTYPEEWVDVSVDVTGSFYGPPVYISSLDRDEAGHVEIPANLTEISLDSVVYTVVRSAAEMNALVEAGITKNVILAADLDYTGLTFKRINLAGSNIIFDGNGYKMYGYALTDDTTGASTFTVANDQKTYTIRNLSVGTEDKKVSLTTSATDAGTLVDVVEGCSLIIDNVDVYATLSLTPSETTVVRWGGFVGFANPYHTQPDDDGIFQMAELDGTFVVKNSSFNGSMNSEGAKASKYLNFGGVVGVINKPASLENVTVNAIISTTSNGYVGGHIGALMSAGDVKMTDCVYYGSIFSTQSGQYGGMIGRREEENIGGDHVGYVTLTRCYNYGSISGNVIAVAGGIIGICIGSGTKTGTPKPAYTVTMTDCANYGNISVEEAAGGLMCGALQNVSVIISNCANYGDVTCIGTLKNVAGIIARVDGYDGTSVTVENCLNAGEISSTTYAAGIVGVSSSAAPSVSVKNSINLGSLIGKSGTAGIIVTSTKTTGTWTLENCGSYAVYPTEDDAAVRQALVSVGSGPATVQSNGGLWAGDNATYVQSPITYDTKSILNVAALLNDTFKGSVGPFILNSTGNGFVLAGVELLGAQQAIAGENKGEYRLIGGLAGATQRYLEVGFELAVNGENPTLLKTMFLNRTLKATENESEVTYSSGDFNCGFLYTVELGKLIPTGGTVTVAVNAYAKSGDGSAVYRGATYSLTFTDGALVSAVMVAGPTVEEIEIQDNSVLTEKNANGYYDIPADLKTVKIEGVTYTVIRSVEDLIAIAPEATDNYILAANLDFSSNPAAFKQIVLGSSIFDGNGFAIYGYQMESANSKGTFKIVKGMAAVTIKNLTLGKADKPLAIGDANTPYGDNFGVVAYSTENVPVTFYNVHVYADIYSTGSGKQTGGFVANMAGGGSATNCSFTGTITSSATGNIGGLIANVNSKSFKIENCTVDAKIAVSSNANMGHGGIVGKFTSAITLDMTNCVFKGSLTAEGGYNGGMVGWQANGTLNLDKCLNAGDITGTTGDAGIVGTIEKGTCTIQNCANIGNTKKGMVSFGTATLKNCVSYTEGSKEIYGADGKTSSVEINAALEAVRGMFPTITFAANDDNTAIVVVESNGAAAGT
ncbi:MAG: hypothetical protein IJZ80_00110 [Clostridia bacterium]|nr:hypothetical protein [Clostridia bacterium]